MLTNIFATKKDIFVYFVLINYLQLYLAICIYLYLYLLFSMHIFDIKYYSLLKQIFNCKSLI